MAFSYLAYNSNGLEAATAVVTRRQKASNAGFLNVKNRSGTQLCLPMDIKTLEKDSLNTLLQRKKPLFC